MNSICNLILEFQAGRRDAALDIISKMYPLLKSYAKKLKYEDAFDDLQLFMIECISKIDVSQIDNCSDGAMVNYFATAIYRKYITLSIALKKRIEGETIKPDDDTADDNTLGYEDDYSELFLYSVKSLLNQTESNVIEGLFYRNLSVNEVAEKYDLSNWNVYKIRDKALSKLRKSIM